MKNYLLMALLAVLTGCASAGRNFNEASISNIQKGKTTEADLVRDFGPPEQRGVDSEGQTILIWVYSEAQVRGSTFIPIVGAFAGGVNTKLKRLVVHLQDDKVSSFLYDNGGFETRGTTESDPTNVVKQPISRK